MMGFQMSSSPKHLSIREVWKLYKILKDGLQDEKEFVVDEISHVMDKIDTASFKKSLGVMFGMDFPKDLPPIEYALMFAKGIKGSGILDFASLIRGLHGSAR